MANLGNNAVRIIDHDGDVATVTSNRLDVNATVTTASTAINNGTTKVVTTAGTDVVLGGDVACKRIEIQAQTDNTGIIAVGATGVDATEATGTGIILYPGDVMTLETDNLSDVFIDSTVDGEGVRFVYFT